MLEPLGPILLTIVLLTVIGAAILWMLHVVVRLLGCAVRLSVLAILAVSALLILQCAMSGSMRHRHNPLRPARHRPPPSPDQRAR
jgi:hypothetical protein